MMSSHLRWLVAAAAADSTPEIRVSVACRIASCDSCESRVRMCVNPSPPLEKVTFVFDPKNKYLKSGSQSEMGNLSCAALTVCMERRSSSLP